MVREFSLIEGLRRRLPAIGDDAAVVDGPSGSLLLCADAAVAGVHADLALVGVDDLGWKALAAAVSDVAAMGGRARYCLVTVSGPLGEIDFDLLFDGLLAASEACGCPIVGGDLTHAPTLVVSVAVVGDGDEAAFGGRPPVLRSGAGPGDTLFVTAPLGAAAAGLALLRAGRAAEDADLDLAHRRPRPRLHEGEAARRVGATAMIDLSDGLASDLNHLADASGVGVVLDRVPVALGVARISDDPEATALGGGEDYELLFSAPDPDGVEAAFAASGLPIPLRIGRCTADPAERRLRDAELPLLGWEHAWPERPSERGARPERPSERGARPERPSERGARPERPSERGARPEPPSERGARPEPPSEREAQ
ncbi:MAG: thiamine-phosphate kinase [Acidimicrobiales bacterium]